jgi:Flp pilus assembly protein TadG
MRLQRRRRTAVTVVEAAIVYPIVLLLMMGVIVGGFGIFRYQQLACLARDAARYAIVHGSKYAKDAGVTAPAPADIYNTVVLPNLDGLDPSLMSYSITYNTTNYQYHAIIVNGNIQAVANTVDVTLTYQWFPECWLVGPFTMSSTSEMKMEY